MVRGFDIPLVEGPTYNGKGVLYTIHRGDTIPWIRVKIQQAGDMIHHRQAVRKPWVGGSIYHG